MKVRKRTRKGSLVQRLAAAVADRIMDHFPHDGIGFVFVAGKVDDEGGYMEVAACTNMPQGAATELALKALSRPMMKAGDKPS